MQKIPLSHFTVGALLKLGFIANVCIWLPLSFFFGVAALFGANTVRWNAIPVHGLSGLMFSFLMGFLAIIFGTLLFLLGAKISSLAGERGPFISVRVAAEIDETDRRRAFWGTLIAAAALFASLTAVTLKSFQSRSGYTNLVQPVVHAVRSELRMHRSLPFQNVRVDRRSRFVCGEVVVKGRVLRFFGKSGEKGGPVVLEGRRPDFPYRYAQLCSNRGHVPT